jgi:beta-glucanase (GH16 family)
MQPLRLLALCALSLSFAWANSTSAAGLAGTSDSKSEKVPFDPSRWTLAWSDEFDRPGAPDPTVWTPEVGYLRNRETQYYTRNRPENARVENGLLVIEARRDNWEGKPITSASLTTKTKRPFLYGRIAVRAKVPTGRGTWPAIWTLGENVGQAGWPACGEIDILEHVGYEPNKVHANIHCTTYNHRKQTGKGRSIDVGTPWTEFHEYAIEWYEDRLEFYFDDTRYFIFRKESDDPAAWPFATPQYLILNLAIGGGWGGRKGVDDKLFPHRFEIDYVRYYRLNDASIIPGSKR